MSMTLEDAWREEAYDRMVEEVLESYREEIIDDFLSERVASYYQRHPDLTAGPESALLEARSLLKSSPTASLVFSRSATEIMLRDVLLKPIAYGMVRDEHVGSLMVEAAIGRHQFAKLLFGVLEEYGIDLKRRFRKGVAKDLWEEIQEVAKIRNQILHHGKTASDEEAWRSLEVAIELLEKIYPDLRDQVMKA